jgi:hypothetical protein
MPDSAPRSLARTRRSVPRQTTDDRPPPCAGQGDGEARSRCGCTRSRGIRNAPPSQAPDWVRNTNTSVLIASDTDRARPPAHLLDTLPAPEQADRSHRQCRCHGQDNRRRQADRLEPTSSQRRRRRRHGEVQPESPEPMWADLQLVHGLRPHALPPPCPLNGWDYWCRHKPIALHT